MIKTVNIETDQITTELSQSFDYKFDGFSQFEVPKLPELPADFGIGLIVGPSGSGKSSLLDQFGKEKTVNWNTNKAICSHFKSSEMAQEKLNAVGFNTVPSWMRPYHVLSTGEKFRADLAMRLENNAVIDEFTSVVDRNVAKSCSYALRRYVDKSKLQNIILATCHYDIIEWLQPDWVYDTATNRLTVGRGSVRRPTVELEILPCSTQAWSMFSKHHYLSANIHKASQCWIVVWNGIVVGFSSTIPFPSGSFRNAWREHRTVVLPDFQGLGLGVRVSDAIGEIYIAHGRRFFSKTASNRLGEYRNHSAHWRACTTNMSTRKGYLNLKKERMATPKNLKDYANRFCYSHEYIGKK
jgi:ABC-type lipoprotein export system ATPase subunit/GNAT superfamily N-acetyltransferase